MSKSRLPHFSESRYHVMLRGVNKADIFNSEKDCHYMLSLFKDVHTKFDCVIHLYCLMTNHIHLVIEVGNIPLSKIMQSIGSRFAQYINRKYDRVGHLFQGRYSVKLITSDSYFLELCAYIHRNPIAANLVQSIDDHHWSSHHAYSGMDHNDWLCTAEMKKIITCLKDPKMRDYNYFINNYRVEQTDSDFCKFDSDTLSLPRRKNNKDNAERLCLVNVSLHSILECICDFFKITKDELCSCSRNAEVLSARALITYFSHYNADYYIKDIAYNLDKSPDSTSRLMHKYITKAKTDLTIQRQLNAVKRHLHSKLSDFS